MKHHTEDNREESTPKSISLKGAIVIVVALHLAVLGFIMLSGGKKKTNPQVAIARQEQEDKDFLSNMQKQEWPQAKQSVVATAPHPKVEVPVKSVSPVSVPVKVATSPMITLPSLPKLLSVAQSTPKPTPKPTPKQPSRSIAKQSMYVKTLKTSPQRKVVPAEQSSKSAVDEFDEAVKKQWEFIANNPNMPQKTREFARSKLSGYTSKSSPEPTSNGVYVLSSGDNLYSVSKRLNVPFKELVEANNIRDVRDLYAGQELIIP
jgi:LysM repeat protein